MGDRVLDGENAPAQNTDLGEARDAAIGRLFTSDDVRVPNPLQQRDLTALNDAAIELGTQIELRCPAGRERSLAWTHLEDTLIRARRAIFEALS